MDQPSIIVTPIIVALVVIVIILALISLTKRATATKMRTLQVTVIVKRRETGLVYVGLFLPAVKYILITDRGLQAENTKEVYEETKIGDKVVVADYSDGVYRVDH